ncbi:MAG: hypothetical protein Kow0089_14490 [Desulfobulbaceae bacterium]
MDFKELLENSWKTFTEFLPAMLINSLVLTIVSVVTFGILAPVCTAGYTQSLLLAIREKRKPEVGDLFSHMNLFLPLLAFTIVAGIVLIIGFAMLVLPSIIAALALYFFCLYMLPLMTDKDLGLVEAVKESSRMAMEEPVTEHVAVVAIYIGLTALGSAIPFGIIFTLPLATLFMLYAFEEKCGEPPAVEEQRETAPPPPPPPPPPQQEKPAAQAAGDGGEELSEDDKSQEEKTDKES